LNDLNFYFLVGLLKMMLFAAAAAFLLLFFSLSLLEGAPPPPPRPAGHHHPHNEEEEGVLVREEAVRDFMVAYLRAHETGQANAEIVTIFLWKNA
jgi:hypothetical protein